MSTRWADHHPWALWYTASGRTRTIFFHNDPEWWSQRAVSYVTLKPIHEAVVYVYNDWEPW